MLNAFELMKAMIEAGARARMSVTPLAGDGSTDVQVAPPSFENSTGHLSGPNADPAT